MAITESVLTKPEEKVVEMTAEIFKLKYPGIFTGVFTDAAMKASEDVEAKIKAASEAGYKKGINEGTSNGASAERNRIKSVQEMSMPGYEAIVKEKAFDGKSTGPETAEAMFSALKKRNAKALNSLKVDAPAPIDEELDEESNVNASADPLKTAWETGPLSAKLKKEFGNNWDSYKGFYENNKHYQETKQVTL